MQRNGAEMPTLDSKWSKDMIMVMQSCLAKETWDRPTAQQLEEYSDAIIKGKPAKVTWNVPVGKVEESPQEQTEDGTLPLYENDDEDESYSNNQLAWGTIFFIIIAAIIFLITSPINCSGETNVVQEEPDSVAVEPFEDENDIDIPEITNPNQAVSSVTPQTRKENSKVKSDESEYDNNATQLNKALAKGDYQQVQRLANQGYAAAYGPLAKYYLNNHDYKTAESYAKKAIVAGYSDGENVLNTLKNLGYYD